MPFTDPEDRAAAAVGVVESVEAVLLRRGLCCFGLTPLGLVSGELIYLR